MKPMKYLRVPVFAAISLPVLIALASSLITFQAVRGMAAAPEESSRAMTSQAQESVREILYQKCGHTLPAEGAAKEQTAPGGVLVADDYCPNHYVVKSGAGGNKIEVYRLSNPGGEPVMTFDVNISWLPEADRQALEQGIRIDSEHDLLALIEDYTS